MKLPHNVQVFIAISFGIIIASIIYSLPLTWFLTGLILIAAAIIQQLYRRTLGWFLILVCLAGGGFWFSMSRSDYQRQVWDNQAFHQREVLVEGTIVSRPKAGRFGFWFIMRLNNEKLARLAIPKGQVIVFIKNAPSDNWYGRKLRVSGRFGAFPPKSTGLPDYFEIEGITGSISVSQTPRFQPSFGLIPPLIWADQIRQKLTRFGMSVLEPRNARLLHGILFGDPLGDEDDPFIINLRRTSTIHLLSVSGMHVGFVALTLSYLLGLLKVPQKWRVAPLIAGVWFYIMMTGMDPPALRAGIMLMTVLIGNILRAKDIPLNRLSLAAIILLMMNPYNLFDPSFQLTFAATYGVSCLYPLLIQYFPAPRKYPGLIWKALLVSLSAQLMIAPILIQYFQMVSWVAPLANLILIIPGEVAVIGGLAWETIGNFQPWLGGLIGTCINYLLNLVRIFVNWLGGFPWAASWSPQWTWPWLAGYYLGLTLFIDLLRPNILNRKQRQLKIGPVLIGFLIFANMLVWGLGIFQLRGDYLQVVFLDVGQGDAILVRSLNGKYSLIDGGDIGRGKRAVLPYFWKNGVLELDRVFLTHYHQDHWGGIVEVLREVPARAIFLPPPIEPKVCSELEAGLKPVKARRQTTASGMFFPMGKGAGLEVLEVPNLEAENDRSVVLLVSFGKIRLLLTGDLSFKGEALLLKKPPHRLKAALLKVGHHGSNYTSGLPFLTQIKPGLAIISVGAENRFGHPGSVTLNRLLSLGVKIFCTDSQGIIDCRIYQDRILIRTTKGSK